MTALTGDEHSEFTLGLITEHLEEPLCGRKSWTMAHCDWNINLDITVGCITYCACKEKILISFINNKREASY